MENCRLIISCSQSKNCLSNPIVYVGWSLSLYKFGSSSLNTIQIYLYSQVCKLINILLKIYFYCMYTMSKLKKKCGRFNYLVNTSDVRNMCSILFFSFNICGRITFLSIDSHAKNISRGRTKKWTLLVLVELWSCAVLSDFFYNGTTYSKVSF